MKRNLGILITTETTPLSKQPLLGKPCAMYVEQALTDAGIPTVSNPALTADVLHALLADDVGQAVLVNDHAPLLRAETYLALLAASDNRPAVALQSDMQTPLAMAFTAAFLRTLPLKGNITLQGLTDTLNERGVGIKVVQVQDVEAHIAVSDAKTYANAFSRLRAEIIERHMTNGVIVLDPERTIIESDVRIGAGTFVYAGNMIQGSSIIGEGCTLYPNNRIDVAVIGDNVTVESSVLLHCTIGARTTVGPYAYLRPDSIVGEHCRIGDFVEIKNSVIGDGTKVSHLTYVGDSDLGKDINLGCGTVFVNYDGKIKSRSRVEDHAFIGCNCNLIAPVHIGQNAYLAAGSTVVEDVPEDALFVARSRGFIKEDWVKRRKEQGKL